MVHVDEFHLEYARRHRIARLDHVQRNASGQPVLLQLVFAQRQRQLRSVYRRREIPQHIRHRADMILMAVRNEIAAELFLIVLQIARVRNHQIDARHILARENRSDIHHNQIVLILINRHVLADFAQAAQRDDLESRLFAAFAQWQCLLCECENYAKRQRQRIACRWD